jgi:hypothetical protein
LILAESSPPWNKLYGVTFTDVNTGTVVGNGGIILRTTDLPNGMYFYRLHIGAKIITKPMVVMK